MPTKKQIVCLAVSWKKGAYCVAGKELVGTKAGSWVRPIGGGKEGAAKISEIQFSSGETPALLDIVEVSLTAPVPQFHQTENWQIDQSQKWRLAGKFSPSKIEALIDGIAPLWPGGTKTDRLPEATAKLNRTSLALIKPDSVRFSLMTGFTGTEQIRGFFLHNSTPYDLALTDPMAFAQLKTKLGLAAGKPVDVNKPTLCVSLSLAAFNGDCYKLIAGVIF